MPGDWLEDDYVRITGTCYKMKGERDGGTLMGEIKQAFGDVNDIATDLGNIIQTGA